MNCIKNGSTIVIVLDNGIILQSSNCTDEIFKMVLEAQTEDDVVDILNPISDKVRQEAKEAREVLSKASNSTLLTQEGDSIYWKGVSPLSMPPELVEKVVDAEKSGNTDALESYKNFWTLMSLNPDADVRRYLFWFLTKWGMRISKSGLFIGYRNADVLTNAKDKYDQEFSDFVQKNYEKLTSLGLNLNNFYVVKDYKNEYQCRLYNELDEEDSNAINLGDAYNDLKAVNFNVKNFGNEDTVYTDHHSHTFQIRIGHMVTMPRSKCNCDSNVSCSRGLHLGGTTWLNQNYYGSQGLVCLCNPADVVAVPKLDDYGKLRTCAYMPIACINYDNMGKVIPYSVEDGFSNRFIKSVLYDGIKSTEDNPEYRIVIPDIPGVSSKSVEDNILAIARSFIKE